MDLGPGHAARGAGPSGVPRCVRREDGRVEGWGTAWGPPLPASVRKPRAGDGPPEPEHPRCPAYDPPPPRQRLPRPPAPCLGQRSVGSFAVFAASGVSRCHFTSTLRTRSLREWETVGWSGSRGRTATGRTRLGHTPSRIGRPETTALSPGSRVLLGGRRHPRVVNASAATLLGLGVTGLLSASQWSSGKDSLIRFQNGIEFKGGLASNDSKAQTNARRLGRGGREPGWKLSSFVPGAGVGASVCRASVSGAVRKASSFFLPPSLAL